MKKFLMLILALGLCVPMTYADRSEQVRVIKSDKESHDLIIAKENGDQFLVQHHHTCSSMTTEFPVNLLYNKKNQVDRLQVAFNEICKVYEFTPYGGDLSIDKRIIPDQRLNKEHEAEVVWQGARYKIDYEPTGCNQLREFVGHRAYLTLKGEGLKGATLFLPDHRGKCEIKNASFIEKVSGTENPNNPPLENIKYEAKNNEVYFQWDNPLKTSTGKDRMVVISYSRYPVNVDEFGWKEMPGLQYVWGNQYTVKRLMNDRKYYFYLAVINETNEASPWVKLEITPKLVQTEKPLQTPEDPFEIVLSENDRTYQLTWPSKENIKFYEITFYVSGKIEYTRNVKQNEVVIAKKPQYKNRELRLTVKAYKENNPFPVASDGHVWMIGQTYDRGLWVPTQK